MGSQCSTGTEFCWEDETVLVGWWWGQLHDRVNVLKATELDPSKWLKMAQFM